MSAPLLVSPPARPFRSNGAAGGWPDWILALALLSAIAPFGLFWTIEPSWPRDLVTFVVLGGTALAARPWKVTSPLVWWLSAAFAGACTLGLLVWSLSLGSKLALNFWSGWSPWLLSGTFLLFSLAYGKTRWREWSQLLIYFAAGIAVVQALGIAAVLLGVGGAADQTSSYGDFYGMRPLHASLALLMLLGFVLLVTSPLTARWQKIAAPLLGLSVVISQHRSVWLALGIVTALLILAMARGRYRDGRVALGITGGYMVFAVLLVSTTAISVLPSAPQEGPAEPGLPDVVTSSRSLQWRLDMWESRLQAPRGLIHWLTGGVFDVTPVKWPGAGVMNPYNTAHNMAMDLLVMFGILGLIVVAALFVIAVWRRVDRLDAPAIFLWSLLGYGMFYYWPSWSWIVIGAALTTGGARPAVATPAGDTRPLAADAP